MQRLTKILNLLLTLAFVAFAALQFNDPDPYVWIGFYLFAALICLLGFMKKQNKVLLGLGLVVSFLWASWLLPSVWQWWQSGEELMQSMNEQKMYIEETRECLGLLICFFAFVFQAFQK